MGKVAPDEAGKADETAHTSLLQVMTSNHHLPTGFKCCQNANELAYPSTVAAYPAQPGLFHTEERPATL